MNSIGNWFRSIGAKIAAGWRRFMEGRYGRDALNVTLICVSFCAYLISLLIPFAVIRLLLLLVYYGLLGWAIFRFLSRNTFQRYQENRKFLRMVERFKDKEHKHFDCPRCRQPVRVPKGKGKICITCPKCGEKFIKKT